MSAMLMKSSRALSVKVEARRTVAKPTKKAGVSTPDSSFYGEQLDQMTHIRIVEASEACFEISY